VASFFVSRVDTAVDRALQEKGETELQGQIAIANAEVAYDLFQDLFSGPRWEELASQGARPQRVLWASTGTKNPAYSDTLYVDSLVADQTVNTMPPATLEAWRDHGSFQPALGEGLEAAQRKLERLAKLGIDLESITDLLLQDGVASFAASFTSLLDSIANQRQKLLHGSQDFVASLGDYAADVLQAQADLTAQNVLDRIFEQDHTVWQESPKEISNRLGWLTIAERMRTEVDDLKAFTGSLRAAGFTHALLLGMGGSSLAPEVFRKTFGVADGYLDLAVLDSTDADAVLAQTENLDPASTLFIVATKSGGTVETLSFFKYFYNWTAEALGEQAAGSHFVAITDPGSKLVDLAETYGFRRTFLNDPEIGGRYSALSYFGLLPAALLGVEIGLLLDRALEAAAQAQPGSAGRSSAFRLGSALGELQRAGRDKLTLVLSPAIESFGDWVEQLVAESTGKSGQGILPVVGETLGKPAVYGPDRFFVSIQLENDSTHDTALALLEADGQPLVRLQLHDLYDLGEQFFLWELATAIAGARMGIQPFDQPNVEAAKKLASRLVEQFILSGRLPAGESASLSAAQLRQFLSQAGPGSYVSLQAYLTPGDATSQALDNLRLAIRTLTGAAVTAGYGPRYLHSTGQLHKGDGGNGLFVQFTSDSAREVLIPDRAGQPDSSISFNVLKLAQALGDFQALQSAEPPRPVVRFHLEGDVDAQIEMLAAGLGG
jgi:transaldolase/glucose-6-phosphate isomerase